MLQSQKWDDSASDNADVMQLGDGGNPVSFPFHHAGRLGRKAW